MASVTASVAPEVRSVVTEPEASPDRESERAASRPRARKATRLLNTLSVSAGEVERSATARRLTLDSRASMRRRSALPPARTICDTEADAAEAISIQPLSVRA